MGAEAKTAQYNVVGLLGTVSAPLSRLVPILQAGAMDSMFALGDGTEGSFSNSNFNELAEAGHVVRLSKYYPVRKLTPKMKPDSVNESQRPFSLSHYALYLDMGCPEIGALKDLLDLRQYRRSAVFDKDGREIWILPTLSLLRLFKELFKRVQRELDELLVETHLRGVAQQQYIDVQDSAAWDKAALLMDLVHDYDSSEQAITYNALMRMTDLSQDAKWYYWACLACRVWDVECGREHWVERVKAKWDALRVRAYQSQLVPGYSLYGQIRVDGSTGAEKGWAAAIQENRVRPYSFTSEMPSIFEDRPASTESKRKPSMRLNKISMKSGARKEMHSATTYSRK